MSRRQLKTIYAEISWYCDPWETITLETRHGERIFTNEGKYTPFNLLDPIENPAQQKPLFWQDVGQWYFAFLNNDIDAIQGYYRTYGQLRVIPEDERYDYCGYEFDLRSYEDSWRFTAHALGWFNLLTCLTDWMKKKKFGPLWELFGSPRVLEDSDIWLYHDEDAYSSFGLYDIRYSMSDQLPRFHDPDYDSQMQHLCQTPQDDAQLLQAAWNVVVDQVEMMLNEIKLSPSKGDDPNKQNLTWKFEVYGAFQAAFLQWYFQELADVNIDKCEKVGCQNAIPPGRKKYCSPQCYAAAAKQRQRKRKNREE
ncbi:MAG: hypothetical protein ACYC0L_06155 [Thermoleophilia bacterium]